MACNIIILEIAVIKVHRDHLKEHHGYDVGKSYIRYEVYRQLGGMMVGITIGSHVVSTLIKLL